MGEGGAGGLRRGGEGEHHHTREKEYLAKMEPCVSMCDSFIVWLFVCLLTRRVLFICRALLSHVFVFTESSIFFFFFDCFHTLYIFLACVCCGGFNFFKCLFHTGIYLIIPCLSFTLKNFVVCCICGMYVWYIYFYIII